MSQATVVQTNIYPCKGLPGISTPERGLAINTRVGVVGDRNFAVSRKPMGQIAWQPKKNFFACVNEAACATTSIPDGAWTEDALDEKFRISARLMQSIVVHNNFLAQGHLVDTKGAFNMADDEKPYVSILNLASVRRFGEYMGCDIDPHRFRMNVWVDGLRPFEELGWCDGFEQPKAYPLSIGDLSLGIDDACERCNAINANPSSGEYDGRAYTDALREFLTECEYTSPRRNVPTVMGILAIPNTEGHIQVGQELAFLG